MKRKIIQLCRFGLSVLAIILFSIDVGTNLYTNFQASDDNFKKEKDRKLAEIRNDPEALRLRAVADTLIALSVRNSSLMVENNSQAVSKVRSGERKKAELWSNQFVNVIQSAANADSAYKAYILRKENPILEEYDRNIARKRLDTITGSATGFAVGILSPFFSLFLMSMSVRSDDKFFRLRCVIGAYTAQFISVVLTAMAIYLMFGNLFIAIGFAAVLFWCAPLVYEAVARERRRLALEFTEQVKNDLEEKEKALAAKEKELEQKIEDAKNRQGRKSLAEKTRVSNLIGVANKLVDEVRANPFKKISKDPQKAAEWFVMNGEPYGMQIKLAEHCGETKSSFNRLVEAKRMLLATAVESGKSNGTH